MAISTYSELKTAVTDWMARADISASATDFITLGEARLNRILEPVATTATLTGVSGSAQIDISALDIAEPENLYVTDGSEEYFVMPRQLGTFSIDDDTGLPSIWAIEGDYIKFNRPCSEDYSFRFIYKARLGLSNVVTTNEFLTKHPDMYLAAAIYWGCVYIQAANKAMAWKSIWDETILEVRHNEGQKKRSQLTVDPALSSIGRGRIGLEDLA